MKPGFWTTEKIIEVQSTYSNLVSSFNKERIKHGKYQLRLSREVLVTSSDGSQQIPGPNDKSLKIPPAQFALLYADESIDIPANAMGFISLKTAEKFKGLMNVSGFHVDPGFKGHLKFTVYNAGNKPIFLDYDTECFLLWFCDLDRETKFPYDQGFQKMKITAKDREQLSEGFYSTAELQKRLEKLEDTVSSIAAVGAVIIFPLLIAFAVPVFEKLLGPEAGQLSLRKLIILVALITSFAIVVVAILIKKALKKK